MSETGEEKTRQQKDREVSSNEGIEKAEPSNKKIKLAKCDRYLRGKEIRKQGRKARKLRIQERRKEAKLNGLDVKPSRPMAIKMAESVCKTRIVLDCAYDHMMSFKDICKLAHQINHCYSSNRHLKAPVQLYVTGLGSAFNNTTKLTLADGASVKEVDCAEERDSDKPTPNPSSTLARLGLVNSENWDIHLNMEDYTKLFPTSSIVYLCAEACDDLPDDFSHPPTVGVAKISASTNVGENPPSSGFTAEDVYVIGGLVDHNHHVGFCFNQALKRGHRTARMPLARAGVELSGRRVLSLLHVFQALATVVSGEADWSSALRTILPSRKFLTGCNVSAKKCTDIDVPH